MHLSSWSRQVDATLAKSTLNHAHGSHATNQCAKDSEATLSSVDSRSPLRQQAQVCSGGQRLRSSFSQRYGARVSDSSVSLVQ
ncbi:uncharacterized protein UV8b_08141 [Ustilaginoidea virens]|uniref:Uncharacterized protein n=1 Tax=Ustilaginoidea virens TaxID=1159556 RepID=A0A8E5HYB9_USTVR|nr:uncharacterized protein UV8b_08141 [Ustilaginoidea virens]QUC23900.1 hypothetical protein UV8b_08141 [Ustilaginoidea virens]